MIDTRLDTAIAFLQMAQRVRNNENSYIENANGQCLPPFVLIKMLRPVKLASTLRGALSQFRLLVLVPFASDRSVDRTLGSLGMDTRVWACDILHSIYGNYLTHVCHLFEQLVILRNDNPSLQDVLKGRRAY